MVSVIIVLKFFIQNLFFYINVVWNTACQKNLILVEGSPVDPIWGVGLHFDDDLILDEKNWKGQNLLGKCLMQARKKLLKN